MEIVIRGIVYDEKLLTYPGDLLHEADQNTRIPDDKSQLCVNATYQQFSDGGEELGIKVCSYATGIASGIPPYLIFHSKAYLGHGQWLIYIYQSGKYLGLPLLH